MYSIAMVAIYRLLVSYDTEAKQESHSNMSYYQSELGCCSYVERENVFQFSWHVASKYIYLESSFVLAKYYCL